MRFGIIWVEFDGFTKGDGGLSEFRLFQRGLSLRTNSALAAALPEFSCA
jgi:hypothetical protein